jgi:SSS family solute:Na+ symporter
MWLAGSSFILFTAIVAFISYLKTRNDKMTSGEDYYLAGRSLTAWVIAGSLILTNLSTEHLVGLNADAFNHTIAVMAWETTAAIAMVLAALYFLPKYLKLGLITVPDYLERRFDKMTRTIATSLFLFSYVVAILPVVLLSGAVGIDSIFDISENMNWSEARTTWVLVWAIGSFGALYAIIGGLKAVAISDTINGVGFLIAGLLIPILALSYVGDGNIFTGMETVYTEETEKFDITGDEPGSFLPFGVLFTGMIVNQIFFRCANQSIIQRAMGAKSLAEGQKGILIASFFKLLGPFVVVLPGVIAFHLFKDQIGQEDYLQAYPMLVKLVLPEFLLGFFAAVMVGAVLSTFNSVLNSSATLFGEGIYRSLFNPNATGAQQVKFGRICSIILALSAMSVAPLLAGEGSLYNYLQKANATFFGPMLAVFLVGIFYKKIGAVAAKVGMVLGPILFGLMAFVFEDYTQSIFKGILGIDEDLHFLHFLGFIFVVTIILMWLTSLIFPRNAEKQVQMNPPKISIDLRPWPHAGKVGLIVVILTLGFYIGLAQ